MTHTGEFHGKIKEHSSEVERATGEYKVPIHFSMTMVLFQYTSEWITKEQVKHSDNLITLWSNSTFPTLEGDEKEWSGEGCQKAL